MLAARLAICVCVLAIPLATVAVAADFRIESLVFAGKEPKPASETTTLFRSGTVYDYLGDHSVAVFDKRGGRFILLDPVRRVRTEVKTSELQAFCDKLQAVAAKESNAYLKFVAEPRFAVTMDEKSEELALISPHMTYRVTTLEAEGPEAGVQYREFSDWYARLNAMTNTGSNPPFPRLALNEELARRGRFAKEVKLTIPPQAMLKGRSITLRSEHTITWRLLEEDIDRMAETDHQIKAFKLVSFNEFRQDQVSKR